MHGTTLIQPIAIGGSTTALQVLQSGGGSVLNVDTMNGTVGVGGATTVATLKVTSSVSGQVGLIVNKTAGADDLLDLQNGGTTVVEVDNFGDLTLNQGSMYFSNDANIYFKDNSGNFLQVMTYSVANNLELINRASTGSVQIVNGNNAGNIQFRTGSGQNLVASLSGTGQAAFQNFTDSTTAFTIQNAASDVIQNTVFAADTQNSRINISGDTNIGNSGNRLFSDNFESGNFSLWNATFSGANITTSTVHDGKYAAQASPAGNNSFLSTHVPQSSTIYERSWVNVSSQTSSTALLMEPWGDIGAGSCFMLERTTTGALEIYNCQTGATSTATAANTLPTGSWHQVEMRVTIGASTGVTQVWVDGTQVINLTGQNNGTNNMNGVQVGSDLGTDTYTAYFDDVSADTQPTGTASSLNVGDSFHVGGTASFGNSLSVVQGSNIYMGTNASIGENSNYNLVIQETSGGISAQSQYFQFLDSYHNYDTEFSVKNLGQALFQNSVDSTTAFQIQRAGTEGTLFNADTQNGTVTVTAGKDTATLGTSLFTGSLSGTGWTPSGTTGSGAIATHTTGTTAVGPSPALSIGSGNNYYVAWTINNANAGSTLTLTMGGQTLATYSFDSVSAGGSIADSASILTSSTANLQITPSSNFTGSISGITVQLQGLNWTPGLVVNNTSNNPSLEVRASSDQGSLFMGYESGLQNSTGTGNTAVGSWALQQNVTGSDNVALGTGALENNTSGDANVALGRNALVNNTSGTDNIAIGIWALTANVQGSGNIAIGSSALDQATLSYDNIAIGQYALNNVTSNYGLVAIGSGAGSSITTGGGNTAVGYASLYNVTTGYNNSAFGQYALQHATGNENAAFGTLAMRYNTTGAQNTAFGTYSLQNNTTGRRNVALGYNAGGQLTTSSDNTLLGDDAGYNLTTGGNNIIIGSGINAVSATGNSQLNIGNVIYGDLSGSQIGIGTSTFSPGFALTVNDGVQAGSEADVDNNGIFSWGASGLTTSIQGAANGVSSYMQFKVNNNVALSFGQQGAATFSSYSPASNAFQIQGSGVSMFNVDTTGNGTVSIGAVGAATNASTVHIADQTNGSGNQIVSIGSTNGSSTLLLQGGSPGAGDGVTIVSGTGSISIGTNGTAHAVNIGSTTGASSVLLESGTGGINLAGQTIVKNSSTIAFRVDDSTGTTNTFVVDTSNRRVGINTPSPSYALDVSDNQASTYVARINNSNTGTSADGLLINLGIGTGTRATGNYYIGFGAAGTVAGKIQGSGTSVLYTTSGADYAEYFLAADQNNKPQAGQIVSLSSSTNNAVQAAHAGDNALVGVISEHPGFLGNGPICAESDDNCDSDYQQTNVIVGMTGQLSVDVSAENGAIAPGDPIAIGSTPGVGVKATQPGTIIGYAMESFSGTGAGTIQVKVSPTYYNGPSNASYLQNGQDASFNNLSATGTTTLDDLNVSGPSTLASLSVIGDANIGGNLTVTGSATIANLTVTGSAQFAGNITIGGHVITSGGQPTAQTQGAVGTGASVAVDGTDTTGTITITTGSSPTAGDLAKILFSKTYGQAPHIVLSPSNDNAAGLRFYKGATSATDFMFDTTDTPQANTTYTFDYFIAQ